MSFTIDNRVQGISENEMHEEIEKEIQYFGFYSGTAMVSGREIEYRRDKKIKDKVVLIVMDYIPW